MAATRLGMGKTALALTARVLIVARDDVFARGLAHDLDQAGWRSITARGVNSGLIALQDFPIEVAIVMLGDDEATAVETAQRLKLASAPRRLPVLAIGRPENAPAEQEGFDLVLAAPLSAPQAAQRLEQLVRAAIAEEELELRRATFAEQGGRLERPRPDPRPLRVLAIGEPTPSFLGLSNVLKQHGVEVTGAFTSYTAFDYLHDRAFDAAVLWGGATHDEALSVAAGLRRNSRLYHLPTLLYLRSSAEIDLADAYRRGLTDVAGAETPEGETALRVIALAKTYRRETAIRQALERARGSGVMEAETGLFTPRTVRRPSLALGHRRAGAEPAPVGGGPARRGPAGGVAGARGRVAGARPASDRVHGRAAGACGGHRRPHRARGVRARSAGRRRGGAKRRRADRGGDRLHRLSRRRWPPRLHRRFRDRRGRDQARRGRGARAGTRRRRFVRTQGGLKLSPETGYASPQAAP